ncbi:hypothetical protein GUJ93_ZPchr0012g19099 [Zizania palustris]|uniref:Uncharacterized protein n=1 Tax=Zizania palustris TaxID=103762 RepID=A0A8J6BQD0_ZIZPA|nr:hypothetical protein GUJ93_ZPchr0012g19099 [Zizania palustris]
MSFQPSPFANWKGRKVAPSPRADSQSPIASRRARSVSHGECARDVGPCRAAAAAGVGRHAWRGASRTRGANRGASLPGAAATWVRASGRAVDRVDKSGRPVTRLTRSRRAAARCAVRWTRRSATCSP